MFAANIPALHSSYATTSYYSPSSAKAKQPKKEKEMLKFENFLCCLSLETGGLVIGWICFILNVLAAFVTLFALIFIPQLSCDDLRDLCVKYSQSAICLSGECSSVRTTLIIALVIGLVLYVVFAITAAFCISGTLKRNHNRVKPMVILLAVASVCGFLNILAFTSFKILFGLISGCLYLYLCICIYSLFYKLRDEFERGLNVQIRPPVNKV